ncbi:MAG: methyltransferase type 11, partial [Actinomycetota bacterium]|nr:methyltransferase type 11 [Actinomycetota bacterium]
GAVVADAWRALPVGDGAVGTVLTVFAPRAPAETARVLRPGGRLVVAAPTPEHLVELVAPLGLVRVDPDKQERLDRALAGYQVVDRALVQRRLVLTPDDVRAAVAMGPSARHVDAGALTDAALARLPRETTLSVSVTGYEPVLAAR